MSTLNYIKSLKNTSPNLLQLLSSYIFGNEDIRLYDPTKVYQKGDMILSFNVASQRFEILQCNTTGGVTGQFEPNKWDKNVVNDFIGGKKSNPNAVLVSDMMPSDPSNLIWYQIVTPKEDLGTDKISARSILIFSADQFIGQDDEPTHPDVKIWFDYEL